MPDIGNTIQNAVIDTTMGVAVGETAGDIATDILLDELIDALVEQYAKASLQMQEKCDKYFGKYVEEDKKKRALLDAGKISKDDYRAWQNSKALGSKQWMDMRDTLAQDLTNCNEIAADIINDRKCDIYALNHNYGMYEIEHNIGAYTSYTLYDHDTVERLIAQNPEILPKAKINIPKDLRWNKHLLTSAVTQGILQGESIPAIAKRMASVTDMDKDAAIRNARTATTGAQNAGRVDSYKHAEKLGIKVTQIWISTLDGRTRTSHRHLMGQKRPLGKPFSNGLLFPGDPSGPGWEVYNCRCTLIAEPDGSGYDLEKTIDKNLSKKGMTFDEWLNEQPLSKHYGESKRHYLERYSEYKKNLSFADWLEDQAAPDSMIKSNWGDKKYGYVYNLIKHSTTPGHGADANNFFYALKDLGQKSGIGNPPQVWNAYMTGQLDAEDMKNFEDILKKYLPSSAPVKVADNISDAVKVADDVTKGKAIHPKAQDSLDQLEFKAGTPMSKDAADTYKVNPLYDKSNYGSTHNCQTTTFTYECRRQGYDVVALPKMVDKNNVALAEYGDIGSKQKQLAQNQANGWINKQTGLPPEKLFSGDSNIKENLEKIIGTNGERYSFSVNWKSGGSHAMNIERDSNGVIHIIDNQRGPLEKNTWTLDEYLSTHSVSGVKAIYRLDDCIPNPEYFNSIVVDASKMKKSLPNKVSDLASKDYGQLYKIAKAANESPSVYYTKYKYGIIDNSDLDKIFNITPKVADKIDDTAEVLPDWVKNKSFDLVSAATGEVLNKAEELKKIKNMTATNMDDLVKQLQKEYFGLSAEAAKKIAKQSGFNLPEVIAAKTDKATAIDMDLLKTKTVSKVWNELKAQGGTAYSQFWKTAGEAGKDYGLEKKQSKVWEMYLNGKLKPDESKKIDDFLLKHYFNKTDNIIDYSKFGGKEIYDILKNYNNYNEFLTAPNDAFNTVLDFFGKNKVPGDAVQKAIDEIKKLEKAKATTQAAKKSDELIKAEEKLKAAQDELKAAEKALKDNVDTFETWDGIWKEEVTLADYAKKKSTISAKKLYYEEEIDKLEHDPNYKSWLSAEDKQDKIWNLQHLYSDLEDFEEAGKKAEKYFNDLEKAQKKTADAQKKVNDLQPAGEAYTQARKDNAKWFTSKSYHAGDKYYSNLSATKNAHKSATSGEHNAYYEYTSASGGFNRPLAGFKAPQYSGGSGWNEKYYKGVGKVPLDNEGKGKDIKNLTSLIEKSKMEDDIWIQTAQNYATLEGKNGFLGIPYGTLSGMTDKELQQFVGVENQLGQFISGSINRGGGSYTPGNMRINIYCPKGSEALYVLSDGAFGKAEHEIILQRGGTYKVSRIYWGTDAEHGGKKLMVDLELRLEKGYNKYEK